MSDLITRRDALKTGGMIAVGLMAPSWLSAITKSDMVREAEGGGKPDPGTVLIVCQLSGGNDGLNTVVPFTDQQYYKLRPTLGIPADKALKLNDSLGLHPSMAGLHGLFKAGKVAVIQGVGYPNPNRSHFRSMDVWQSASPELKFPTGWIGRYMDMELANHGGTLNPVVGLGLSTEKPRALAAEKASVPCFASLADIQGMVGDADMEKMLRQIQGSQSGDASARAIQQANNSAFDAMSILRDRLSKFKPAQNYGDTPFGTGFKQIANLVATSPQTRVIYFSVGGFDTHARQADAQERLLGGLSTALAAFQAEVEALGMADKVMVLVFSEFGRRSFENASGGTDHGAAAPMFLVGKKVKGGVYGKNPDLLNLQDGDLRFTTDFRSVYAATLDEWMGSDSGKILGGSFGGLKVF